MKLKMVIPKGRMFENVNKLLAEAGIHLIAPERNYRPTSNDDRLSIKLLKSANIPSMIERGQHDCGFAGYDWICEQKADVKTLIDLEFDPVRIVACIPEHWDWEEVKQQKIVAVSEYRNLTEEFLREEGVLFDFERSYGATEVFPPEDAHLIVDNTSTGSTLRANRLKVVKDIMSSATRFIVNPRALDNPQKRAIIEDLVLLFRGVLHGRNRVLLEMNCPKDRLEVVDNALPAMKSPTIAELHNDAGYSVKAAVPKSEVAKLIPKLLEAGATDILELPINKVIPSKQPLEG